MSKINGFILFSILMFLPIFSLLGLYGFTSLTQKLQLDQLRFERKVRSSIGHHLLNGLEQLNFKIIPCLIEPIPLSEIIKKNAVWWNSHACEAHFKHDRYYYIVEFLTQDPCIQLQDRRWKVANYYRISLYLPDKRMPLFLQSTTVLYDNSNKICESQPHFVDENRQMIREI